MGCKSGRANGITFRHATSDEERKQRRQAAVRKYREGLARGESPARGLNWATLPSKSQKLVVGHGFQWQHCRECGDVRLHHHGKCASAHRHA